MRLGKLRKDVLKQSSVVMLLLFALLVFGCAPVIKAPPQAYSPIPETHPVLLVNGALPPSVQYATIGPLEVRLPPPGNVAAFDKVRGILATEARKVGANAVIQVSTKYAWTISGWTTFGAGMAIRLPDDRVEQVAAMPHVQEEWR